MLALSSKQLVVYNDTLIWEDFQDDVQHANQLVIISTDSKLIVTCENRRHPVRPKKLRVWDSSTFQLIGEVDHDQRDYICDLQISPNNQWIMYFTSLHIYVFETYNLNTFPIIEYNQDESFKKSVVFTSDSKSLITSGKQVKIYQINDKITGAKALLACEYDSYYSIQCRKNILICVEDHKIQIWNTNSNKNIHNWLSQGKVKAISQSSNGQIVVTAYQKDSIKLWSTQTKKLIRKYVKCSKAIEIYVNLSPNGQLMISKGCDQESLLWNIQSGQCFTFDKPNRMTNKFQFTPDGRYIVTGQINTHAKFWDISQLVINF